APSLSSTSSFEKNNRLASRPGGMQIFDGMIRSLAFTNQGRLHTKDIDLFLMPTLLADTNLFLWVDLEKPTPEETQRVLEQIFHFHPLSIEDCVAVSAAPKVEEYTPKED